MAYTTSGDLAPMSAHTHRLVVIDLVLTRRAGDTVDELERLWHARESAKRWDDSDQVCTRLLDWLRRGDTRDE